MHIAQRHPHDAHCHPALVQLHRVAIGASTARRHIHLIRNVLRSRALLDEVEHDGVRVRPAHHARPFAHIELAITRLAQPRIVHSVVHVYGETALSTQCVGRGPRPPQSNLFLHGGNSIDSNTGIQSSVLLQETQGFGDDKRPHLVVETTGSGAVTEQVLELPLVRRHVAEADEGFGFLAATRPDVDPHVLHFWFFLAFFVLQQVDGLAADDSRDLFAAMDPHPLPHNNRAVVPANGAEIQHSLIIDVVDDKADFVHMPGEHDFHLRIGVGDGPGVAMHIGVQGVGEIAGVLAENLGRALFISAGAGGVDNGLKKVEGFVSHRCASILRWYARRVPQVEFLYRARRDFKSVEVGASWNGWDRSAMPLVADGRVWRGVFDVPEGVHEYRFVIDGERWVRDTSRPAIRDANSNVNTGLVVSPFSGIAARGDGSITHEAFLHEPSAPWMVRICEEWVHLDVRVRARDVERVMLVHPAGSVRMRRLTVGPIYEVWRARVQTGAFSSYFFRLIDKESRWDSPEFSCDFSSVVLPVVPQWAKDAVFYQIFPDRFGFVGAEPERWRQSVFEKGFFGGTLAGVQSHLDHIRGMGFSGIYFTPIFRAESYHAYDTTSYEEIDPHFGTNESFRELMQAAKAQGLRVVLDGVFNHSSVEFFAFNDIRKEGEKSPYTDWYWIHKHPVEVRSGQKTYTGWAGVSHMPKLNQDTPSTQEYFLTIGEKWIEEFGIDGWRLDVANEVSPEFWRHFRERVRAKNPEALVIGEHWDDGRPWLQGDQWDTLMNYRWRTATLDLFSGRLKPEKYGKKLEEIQSDYPAETLHVMYNLLGSHDTPRIRTLLENHREKERLAYVLLLAYPGIASIYYGDEVGMEGGHDPDCRRIMSWNPNDWDIELLHHIRRLIRLRRTWQGAPYQSLKENGLYAFRRGDIHVYTNPTSENRPLPNPRGETLSEQIGPWGWRIVRVK